MLKYGFPVGPMALVDEVGITVAASVGKNLKSDLGVRVSSADPKFMEEILARGYQGRKNGKGMYVYPSSGKKSVNPEVEDLLQKCRGNRPVLLVSNEDIPLRMVSRFVNEAALCLQDGIIANPTVGGTIAYLLKLLTPVLAIDLFDATPKFTLSFLSLPSPFLLSNARFSPFF